MCLAYVCKRIPNDTSMDGRVPGLNMIMMRIMGSIVMTKNLDYI